jgi:hypothetical protein
MIGLLAMLTNATMAQPAARPAPLTTAQKIALEGQRHRHHL